MFISHILKIDTSIPYQILRYEICTVQYFFDLTISYQFLFIYQSDRMWEYFQISAVIIIRFILIRSKLKIVYLGGLLYTVRIPIRQKLILIMIRTIIMIIIGIFSYFFYFNCTGMLVASLFSTLFGRTVHGSVYVSQTLNFKRPVHVGECWPF